jgi:hypothetical protein
MKTYNRCRHWHQINKHGPFDAMPLNYTIKRKNYENEADTHNNNTGEKPNREIGEM